MGATPHTFGINTFPALVITSDFLRADFLIQPSIAITHRTYQTKMPDGFKQKDDKWSKFTGEPELYFGFNF